MAVQGLIQYVQERLNQGYDAASIRSFLLGQGYPSDQVDAAFSYLRPRKKSFSKARFFGSALFVIGVALIMLASMKFVEKEPQAELDIRTEMLTESYEPGSKLELKVGILSENPATLTLRYKVSEQDGKAVFYKEETMNVFGSQSFKRSIQLPEDLAGDYTLDTEAVAGEKSFVSRFEFSIAESEVPEEIKFEVKHERTFVRKDPTAPTGREFMGISTEETVRMEGI